MIEWKFNPEVSWWEMQYNGVAIAYVTRDPLNWGYWCCGWIPDDIEYNFFETKEEAMDFLNDGDIEYFDMMYNEVLPRRG